MTNLELVKVGKSDPIHYGFEEKILKIKQAFEQRIQREWDIIDGLRGKLKFPEARGHLKSEYIRCGKQSCKCLKGALHGPYWYIYQKEGGCLLKTYIGQIVSPQLRQGIKNRTDNRPLRKSILLMFKEISCLEREKEKRIRKVRRMQREVEAKLKLISS